MRAALHGAEYVPRQDPPQIVQQPWNNLVVTSVITIPAPVDPNKFSVFSVSIKEAGDGIWQQLGASQNPGITFKILRAALWLTEGSYFSVTFYDLQRSALVASANESTIEDSAAKNHFARVGWKWSSADSSVPYETSGDSSADKKVLAIKVPAAATCLLHLQVQWRGKVFSDIGSQVGEMAPLAMCRSSLTTDQQRVVNSVERLRGDLNRDQDRVSLALDALCGLLRDRAVIVADRESS